MVRYRERERGGGGEGTMACAPASISAVLTSSAKDVTTAGGGLRRSASVGDVLCNRFQTMRRSRSEPLLRLSLRPSAARSAPPEPMLGDRPAGISPFPFLYESEGSSGVKLVEEGDGGDVEESPLDELGKDTRANWVERLLELRRLWKGRQGEEVMGESRRDDEEEMVEEEEAPCTATYESEEGEGAGGGKVAEFDREAFSSLLSGVPWGEIKLLSQLAFLCNVAYVIPLLKAEDLRSYYDLRWVTSSLEKKSEAAASAGPPTPAPEPPRKRPNRPAAAYGIAASAACYVHSRTMVGGATAGGPASGEGGRVTRESGMAADVATSTMTAVVAAGEEAKREAARDLRSLHSSPCEWFVCDDPATCTRYFVIQGSDSLSSWQANLLFDPTKFEGTEALVHRGIYEAAKGIYDQFLPEILVHLSRHGARARLRFTGHSLGGSLSLLVHLMLLARGVVAPSALLPVVTFGSPFVFCGGRRLLDDLGVAESQVRCVVMHRDIVPRAFSCSYPDHFAQLLKRLSRPFRSHHCLHKEKLLYSPLGKLYILQPDDKFSPPHPLLPPGSALYALDGRGGVGRSKVASAVRAFLNTPHPLETLRNPAAYGSEGTILRDHDSSNYLKAVNGVLRRHTRWVVTRTRERRLQHWWPLLTATLRDHPPWRGCHEETLVQPGLQAAEEVVSAA